MGGAEWEGRSGRVSIIRATSLKHVVIELVCCYRHEQGAAAGDHAEDATLDVTNRRSLRHAVEEQRDALPESRVYAPRYTLRGEHSHHVRQRPPFVALRSFLSVYYNTKKSKA